MPKPITQDALMNEHDASNSNATLVNNCKSKNVPFSHMHYTMHIISISITPCICSFTQFETQNHGKKNATLLTYPKGINTALRYYSHTEKHFIYYVLAFRQCKTIYSIYHIIFINKNFILFLKIFSLILYDFILFYFSKKKNLKFTVHS